MRQGLDGVGGARQHSPMSEPVSFSHLDADGAARMVDVAGKAVTRRIAIAEGILECLPSTIEALKARALPKGDVLTVAKIAGIQAAKRTGEWIPLCHTLPLDSVDLSFSIETNAIRIRAEARVSARTGVEMEALTAVSAAALTIYDMCKAVDKTMVIREVRLLEKRKE